MGSKAFFQASGYMLPTTRCPRMPTQGHGRRHLTHLAAGLRLGGYATQLEDLSACYLNQEDPFE